MTSSDTVHNAGIRYAALSDVGMKRPMNQDAHAITGLSDGGYFFVVADGMGAHAAGELASQIAVEEVESHFRSESYASTSEGLAASIKAANAAIYSRGQQDTQLYNMGTTCTVLVFVDDEAWVAHVGDSRAYRYREERMQQLTFDHSLVWEMRAAGQLNRSDHDAGIPRNVITRCLGPHAEVEADIEGPFSIKRNDVFLLCSDGLTGRVTDAELGVISGTLAPAEASQFLVDLANLRGGSDNVTVISVRVGDSQSLSDVKSRAETPAAAGTHPAWWFGAAVGLLATTVALAMERPQVAMVGGGLFLVSVLGAGIQWLRQMDRRGTESASPYVTVEARLQDQFVGGVADTFDETISVLGDRLDQQARQAIERGRGLDGDPVEICRELASHARRLMVALRDENVRK